MQISLMQYSSCNITVVYYDTPMTCVGYKPTIMTDGKVLYLIMPLTSIMLCGQWALAISIFSGGIAPPRWGWGKMEGKGPIIVPNRGPK